MISALRPSTIPIAAVTLALLAWCSSAAPAIAQDSRAQDSREQDSSKPERAANQVRMPDGLTVDLPEGWRLKGSASGTTSKNGLRRIQFVCETERCKKTEETCTILMRDTEIDGVDDAARTIGLYASPMKRYFRLRAVLKSTGRDAELRQPLELTRIGARDWQRVETDARHNFKSGLFVETVINGRYVGGICKTCERGEVRYRDGLAILSSLSAPDSKTR